MIFGWLKVGMIWRGEWSFASRDSGGQCVIPTGMIVMQWWPADSSVLTPNVSNNTTFQSCVFCNILVRLLLFRLLLFRLLQFHLSSTQHFYFYLLLFAALLSNFDLPIKGLYAFVEVLGVFLQGTSNYIIWCTNTKMKVMFMFMGHGIFHSTLNCTLNLSRVWVTTANTTKNVE